MANEVMKSLFGMSSYEAEDALRRQQTEEDYKYATLDPRQQIIFNARQAGRSIGGGINQMFGLVPEQLQRVRGREGALASVQKRIASGELSVDDPIKTTQALIEALVSSGNTSDAAKVLEQFQENYPEWEKANAAKLRAEQAEKSKAFMAARQQAIAEVEQALQKGETPDPTKLSLAKDYLVGLTTPTTSTGFDAFGNKQDIVRQGNPYYAMVYPGVAALLQASMPTTTVGPLSNAVEGSPAPAAVATPVAASPEAAPLGAPATTPLPATAPLEGRALQPVTITPSEAAVPPVAAPAPVAVKPATVATPAAPAVAPVRRDTAAIMKDINNNKPPAVPAQWTPQSKAAYDADVNKYKMEAQRLNDELSQVNTEEGRKATVRHQNAMFELQRQQQALAERKYSNEEAKDKAAQEAAFKNSMITLASVNTNLSKANKLITQELIGSGINTTTGIIGNLLSGVGMPSNARVAANALNSAIASLTVENLQNIRRSSPTGAALGNSSDRDIALLQDAVSVIDRSQDPAEVLNAIAQASWLINNYNLVAKKEQPILSFVEPYQKITKSSEAVRGAKYYIIGNKHYPAAAFWAEVEKRAPKKEGK